MKLLAVGIVAVLCLVRASLGQCPTCPLANDKTLFSNTFGRICIRQSTSSTFPVPSTTVSTNTYDAPNDVWNVAIDIADTTPASWSTPPVIEIVGNTSFNVGIITIRNQISSQICDVYVHGCTTFPTPTRTGSIRQIIKDPSSTGEVRLVECRLAGDVGAGATSPDAGIQVDSFNTGDIGGSVKNGIKITKGGSSSSSPYSITNVTVGGSIEGDLTLTKDSINSAYIGTLTVAGTISGPSSTTSTISAPGGIGNLEANSINANITTVAEGGIGSVHHLKTTSTTVPYAGTMDLYNVWAWDGVSNPGIQLGASLTGTIRIRNALHSSNFISLPSGGLQGNIFINTADHENSLSYWSGYAEVGTVKITPNSGVASTSADVGPAYTRLSSTLGGGTVGLVGYRVYTSECEPPRPEPHGALLASAMTLVPKSFDNEAKPVVIRFHGPIRRKSTSAPYTWNVSDVKLECIPLSNVLNPCAFEGSWFTIAQGNLSISGPLNTDTGTSARTLRLGCSAGLRLQTGVYRVTFPGVGCAGLDTPANVMPPLVTASQFCPNNDPDNQNGNDPESTRAYYFRVGPDCDEMYGDDTFQTQPVTVPCPTGCADYDQDNGVEVADIFDFLNEWFAACCSTCSPPTGSGCMNNADFNGNGVLEVQDIFDFLNSWFVGDTLCH